MAETIQLQINDQAMSVKSSLNTPLLYVLTDELHLQGPRFGCGLAQCGSCSVLVDGVEIRSCVTPLASVIGAEITTLEGLPFKYAQDNQLSETPEFSPVQAAFISEQAIQCGYCFNGMTIKATELLSNNQTPTEAEIKQHMNGHLCRCGTYPKIIKAIQIAANAILTENGEET